MTTTRVLLFLLLASACGRIGYDPLVSVDDGVDAGDAGALLDTAPLPDAPDMSPDLPPDIGLDATPDATPDTYPDLAPPACTEPFSTPAPLTIAGVVDDVYSPRLGPDGLTLFFSVQASIMNRNSVDLYFATRPAVGAAFSNPRPLTEANTSFEDGAAFVTSDSLELFFFSFRPASPGGRNLWVLRRDSSLLDWDPPRAVSELNSDSSDYMPSLTGDGLTIFFASNRTLGADDLWMARRPSRSAAFGPPSRLAELSDRRSPITSPFISVDGRTLYFADERDGGQGVRDLWFATRPDTDAQFGPPINLGPRFNSGAIDDDPALSLDGRELLFVSDRGGGRSRIYYSIRCP